MKKLIRISKNVRVGPIIALYIRHSKYEGK